jgi:hypothetical protein
MSEKNGENVICCMCVKNVYKENTFIPSQCLLKHGDKAAHRICVNCWWNPESGFAREYMSHKCPGCLKGLLLTEYKIAGAIVVDLTDK